MFKCQQLSPGQVAQLVRASYAVSFSLSLSQINKLKKKNLTNAGRCNLAGTFRELQILVLGIGSGVARG